MDVRLSWLDEPGRWIKFLRLHRERAGGDGSGLPSVVDGQLEPYEPWLTAFRRRQVCAADANAASLRLAEGGIPHSRDHLRRLLFLVSDAFDRRKIEESRQTPRLPEEPSEQTFAPWLARPPQDPLRRIAERVLARHGSPCDPTAHGKPATGTPTKAYQSPARNSRDSNPASPTPV
jgi:hypothetical protein